MSYLLDSDILIYYTNNVREIRTLITSLVPEGIAISTITYMEARQGVSRSTVPADANARLNDLIRFVPMIAFSQPEAHRCAELRQTLQDQGKRVRQRALDLMIATTAIEHDLTLVTNNPSDYDDIPDLRLRTPRMS